MLVSVIVYLTVLTSITFAAHGMILIQGDVMILLQCACRLTFTRAGSMSSILCDSAVLGL